MSPNDFEKNFGKRKFFTLLAAIAFMGAANEALAETTSKKKKRTENASAVAVLEATAQSNSKKSVEFLPAQLPAGQRQLQLSSVQGSELSSTSFEELGRYDTHMAAREYQNSVDKASVAANDFLESKKKTQNAGMGVFRTKDIASGYVPPPGVADFAWYFKASSAGNKNSLAGTVYASRPGSMTPGEFQTQLAAEELRKQTVESIRQILMSRPAKEQRLELLFRLSEIQIERQAFATELEIRKFNEEHDRWMKSAKQTPEPVFKLAASEQQRVLAADALRTIARDFPLHSRTADALFTLGFLLAQSKGDSPAPLYLTRLVKDFPKSDLVPDAHLALGEYFFSRNQFSDALKSYQKVLEFREKSPMSYNYAVYKLGWTFFNLRSADAVKQKESLAKSLAAFKLVVKRAEQKPGDKILEGLKRDALRDIVLVFADQGDIVAAEGYFKGLGEQELYLTMLERLAWQYSENGEFAQAIAISQRLIAEAPEHEKLPMHYARVPEFFEKQGNTAGLLEFLNTMSMALAPSGVWYKKFQNNSARIVDRDSVLRKQTLGWAERFHADAQKTGREKRYLEALTAYDIYLANFGEKPESYKAHFFKAEILAQRGQFAAAADSYLKAVEIDRSIGGKGKYTMDAVVNAIACLDRVLEKQRAPSLLANGVAEAKTQLDSTNGKLLQAIDIFLTMFPADQQGLEFAHRAARIQHAFGDYASARKRWYDLALKYPRSKEARDGLRQTLKVYIEKKDWDGAIANARQFLGIQGVREADLGQDLQRVLKYSLFSKALALEQREQRVAAAELFSAYQREFQDDFDAPKALFNAASNRFKVGMIDEAIAVLGLLRSRYPQSPLSSNALYMVASANESLGRLPDSAAGYEQFAQENPSAPVAADVLLRAAEQRFAVSQHAAAQKDLTNYLARYPKHSGEVKALFLMASVLAELKRPAEASKLFFNAAEKAQAKDLKTAVHLSGLAADAAMKSGEKNRASSYVGSGLQMWNSLSERNRTGVALEGARLLAQTQFAIIDEKRKSLFEKKILDGSSIVEDFSKIKSEGVAVEKRYAEIVKIGNAEAGVAALYRIAEVREFLANTLLNAPAPEGANAAEAEDFKAKIEKIALPMNDEATKLYFAAWQKSNESDAITPFQQKLHAKLSVLKPSEFKSVIAEIPAPTYFSGSVAWDSKEAKK